MITTIRLALPALLALGAQFPGTAFAQSNPAPMNPAAAAAPLKYESAFAGYKPAQEPAAVAWKESNARVAQPLPGAGEHDGHGGHAGHDMGGMKHGADKKAVDEHAGHDMGGMKHGAEKKAADEHAGHDMGGMDHGGHKQAAPPSKKDPHQGHQHKE
ncbi:MAG TPA: hypothetical protein VGD30_04120 [Telluria sp.]